MEPGSVPFFVLLSGQSKSQSFPADRAVRLTRQRAARYICGDTSAIVIAKEVPLSFSVATYNVLANAYAHRAWYRRTPSMVLDPAWRTPALARYISALKADLLCLQEVEPEVLARLRAELAGAGYDAHYARKGAGRPDGLAIFYRTATFAAANVVSLAFADGAGASADSGYLALIALFQMGDRILGVINAHLIWDAPGVDPAAQRGYLQARQLLAEYQRINDLAGAWILAGDLNVTPDSALAAMIREAGLDYAHRKLGGVPTCNVRNEARMIDYLYHSTGLCAEPEPSAPIDDQTILPSASQPSDHVALTARFIWKD